MGKPTIKSKPCAWRDPYEEKKKKKEEIVLLTFEEWAAQFRVPAEETIAAEIASSYVRTVYQGIAHGKERELIRAKRPTLALEHSGTVPMKIQRSIPTPAYTECVEFSPDGSLLACCCYDEVVVYALGMGGGEGKGSTDQNREGEDDKDRNGKRDNEEVEVNKEEAYEEEEKNKEEAAAHATLPHESNVWRCCFHPSLPLLFSVCGKGNLYAWNTMHWELVKSINVSEKCLFGLALHTQSGFIAVSGLDHHIHVYDLNDWDRKYATLKAHMDSVEHVAFTPDGWTLVSGSKDRSLRLWNVRTIREHDAHDSSLSGISTSTMDHSKHDRSTHSAAHDSSMSEIETGTMGHSTHDTDSSIHDSEDLIDLGAHDETTSRESDAPKIAHQWGPTIQEGYEPGKFAHYWNRNTINDDARSTNKNRTKKPEPHVASTILGYHDHWVMCATFTSCGKKLVTASADGEIKVWCLETNTKLLSWVGHTNIIWTCATACLSSGLEVLLTASSDGTLRVWYLKSGVEVGCAGRLGGKSHGEAQLLSMGVHPDGRRVAVGTFHERAYLLQLQDVTVLPWESRRSLTRSGVSWASAPSIRCYSTDDAGQWVWDVEVEERNTNSNASVVAINMTHDEWMEWVEKEGAMEGVGQGEEEGNTNSNASRKVVIKLTHEEWLEWQRRGAGTAGGPREAGAEEGVLAVDGKFNVSGNNLLVA